MAEIPLNGNNGSKDTLTVSIGNMTMSVRGITTIFALSVIAIITSNLYAGNEIKKALEVHSVSAEKMQQLNLEAAKTQWGVVRDIEKARLEDAAMLRQRMDLNNCMMMFEPPERKVIRQRRGGWWEMCPWMERPKDKGGIDDGH